MEKMIVTIGIVLAMMAILTAHCVCALAWADCTLVGTARATITVLFLFMLSSRQKKSE